MKSTLLWSAALAALLALGCDETPSNGDAGPDTPDADTRDGGEDVEPPEGGEDRADDGADTGLPDGWVDPPTERLDYAPDDTVFLNPERGFYRSLSLVEDRDYEWVREEGATLAHSYVRLDDYRERDLEAALLEAAAEGFAEARAAGIKIVLRFAYNFGPYPDSEPDASKAVILRHLEQLAPLLRDHAGVIFVLQAGFIGAWGEWHTSTNGLLDDPRDKFDILEAELAALPADRSVQLRYPPYKQEGYGGPLTAGTAFAGTPAARVGHHNDCFLASDDDEGTYPEDEIEAWKEYVAADTLWTPMGGETCAENPPRSECAVALAELERLHWTYLNAEYHPEVVAGWESGGCRTEMERRLGYRIAPVSLEFSGTAPPGGTLPVRLVLRNDGWAAPVNPRPVVVVLDGPERREAVLGGLDPRRWLPGEEVRLDLRFRLPADLAPGRYALGLWLPDAAPELRDDPRYALRLAGRDGWRETDGLNVLAEVEIAAGAPGSTDPSFAVFEPEE